LLILSHSFFAFTDLRSQFLVVNLRSGREGLEQENTMPPEHWRACRLLLLSILVAALNVFLAAGGPAAAQAQDRHHHHESNKGAEKPEPVEARRIPDVSLTDQTGRQVHFVSDILQQHAAVVSFIYTSCETTCPLVGATMAAIADRFQKDRSSVAVLSVTVDPDYDTPARLLAWRERFGDNPQWTLLTGNKPDVEQLLRALGVYSANLDDHADILLIGPDAAGRWTRLSAFADMDTIATAVAGLASN
jgi:protein SCO1/2